MIYVVSGPSGVGKGTVVAKALEQERRLKLSISYTTRSPKAGERNGVDYHFTTREIFERMVNEGRFVESNTNFGELYGTPHPDPESVGEGDLVLEIDYKGAFDVKKRLPEAQLIFILPPSRAELERRLRARGRDTEEEIGRRLTCAEEEVLKAGKFDWWFDNEDLDNSIAVLLGLVSLTRFHVKNIPRLTFRNPELLGRIQASFSMAAASVQA